MRSGTQNEKKTCGDNQQDIKPGEKGFSIFLFLLGAFFLYHSIQMYMKKPGAASYAAVPIFVSSAVVILALVILATEFKANSNKSMNTGIKQSMDALRFVFSKDILVVLGLIAAYSIGLYMGLGFYIMTPIFLWVGMNYLTGKNYVKNILWTALSMVFVYIVFSYMFHVVLP